jgi:uncharacterized protein YwqG
MASLFRDLFGKPKVSQPIRDIAALVRPLVVPALQVVVSDLPSLSHFGGSPQLPNGTGWPEKGGRSLDFLARLSLSEIQRAHSVPWLPQSGALLFFYDIRKHPWGFDPNDRGGFAALHVPDLPEPVVAANHASKYDGAATFNRNVSFRHIDVVPSEGDPVRDLKLNDAEYEKLSQIDEAAFDAKPKHQVAGIPSPVQGNDMDLECQLASNGVYCGNAKGYESARATELESGRTNWRLLFQMDSDDDLDVMWGDAGMLYYWIEEQEAQKGNFRNSWLIQQCF